ncbi:hypothetical protein SAMN06295905_2084 [Devosia lucknowensis]|uniref:Holin-X, holin superfamily III n=1 Tax=Devosia lucknowensis TaxID=1096929 RepID=A0A1Y6FBP7_9HYPH|nr:hypothetical protein [Devosia lucknowensis]SMQ72207.1 hypothetical protein SAMN06295905_2084 [Devosia lucknowensis]
MGLIGPLAALLGLEVEGIAARAKAMALVYGLIGLFSAIAIGFLLAAGFMVLADEFGPLAAAQIMAGVFLLLALAVYLGSMVGRNKRQRELAEKRRASESGAFLTTAALTALPLLAKSPAILRLGLPAAAIAAIALLRDNKRD